MKERNSDAFLGAFSTIENALKKAQGNSEYTPFPELLNNAGAKSAVVRKHKDELKMFASLRNAIAHQRIELEAIAEPHDHVVAKIQAIASKLENPPSVFPAFREDIQPFALNDAIGDAAAYMYQHSYSQVVIVDKSVVCSVLTANTLARWLGRNVAEGLVDLEETPVSDVLECAEFEDNFKLVSKACNCYEAIEMFQQAQEQGKPLDALLISEHGRSNETTLGIITPFQMPELIKIIS